MVRSSDISVDSREEVEGDYYSMLLLLQKVDAIHVMGGRYCCCSIRKAIVDGVAVAAIKRTLDEHFLIIR